jgi:ABC-type transporter Mla MlaB component
VQFKAEVDSREGFRIVRLVGRLQREHADELLRLCEEPSKLLRLDLTDLVSIDAGGLETLLALQRRGAALERASPYIALRLDGARPGRVRASRANRHA